MSGSCLSRAFLRQVLVVTTKSTASARQRAGESGYLCDVWELLFCSGRRIFFPKAAVPSAPCSGVRARVSQSGLSFQPFTHRRFTGEIKPDAHPRIDRHLQGCSQSSTLRPLSCSLVSSLLPSCCLKAARAHAELA